ncbi:MAG: isochorismatase family protein [Pseudomonadales bacterium]|nr:isochorismatase family protein [Pseudomonadales bacterium]
MAINQLDKVTALVLVDLQKGVVALPMVHSTADIVKKVGHLVQVWHRRNLPVIAVRVLGGAPGRTEQTRRLDNLPDDWAQLEPALGLDPTDHVVTKHTWGAFSQTDLYEHLKHRGVTQVVVAGIATSIGVESTARQAHELGFNVTLAIDAMTDFSMEAHQNSLVRIFPRLGETGTVQDIEHFFALN